MEEIKEGYTRVSEIIAQWGGYEGVPKDILERKAQIGSYVHAAIEMHINIDCAFPMDPEADAYYQSYLKWRESTHLVSIESERRYYSDAMKITGQVDALAILQGSTDRVLIDWKTSYHEMKCNWQLQGAFYWMLAFDNGVTNLSHDMMFVKLNKNGDLPDVYTYKFDMDLKQACMNALGTYRYREPFMKKSKKKSCPTIDLGIDYENITENVL